MSSRLKTCAVCSHMEATGGGDGYGGMTVKCLKGHARPLPRHGQTLARVWSEVALRCPDFHQVTPPWWHRLEPITVENIVGAGPYDIGVYLHLTDQTPNLDEMEAIEARWLDADKQIQHCEDLEAALVEEFEIGTRGYTGLSVGGAYGARVSVRVPPHALPRCTRTDLVSLMVYARKGGKSWALANHRIEWGTMREEFSSDPMPSGEIEL